ncbi:MAG TPA: hypothetical protein VNH64_07030 [Parvularculaceae bacterium]|nr:hypothetical protein [Parvularculaceae bacterium]
MKVSKWLAGGATVAVALISTTGAFADDWWQSTKISGRMYFDTSYITQKSDGSKAGLTKNGYGFDIKRFYVGIDHKFNDIFSANITTDFTYDSGAKATQIFIKKAYLQAHINDMLDIRLGATDLPWVPFAEGVYGYRHIENTLIDRTKFGTSSDWGVHASGKLADGLVNYAVAVINGAGYKNPPGTGGSADTHFKTIDFEGRVNLNYEGFVAGVGGYTGKLGKDVQGATTFHRAKRVNAIGAYTNKQFRIGVEYFKAWDWNNVTSATSESSWGYGPFASFNVNPEWSVFGRWDHVKPNDSTVPALKDNYFNVGVQWEPTKIVDLALVYKRDKADNGFISTSNGTIGGATNGTYDEFGLFGQLRW